MAMGASIEIKNMNDAISLVQSGDSISIFRGQGCETDRLIPSIARNSSAIYNDEQKDLEKLKRILKTL